MPYLEKMAALCDVFLWMDAFGSQRTAHKRHSWRWRSFAPIAVAGPLLSAELEAVEKSVGKTCRRWRRCLAAKVRLNCTAFLESLSDKGWPIDCGVAGICEYLLSPHAGFPCWQLVVWKRLYRSAKALMAKPVFRSWRCCRCDSGLLLIAVSKSVKNCRDVAPDEHDLDLGQKQRIAFAAFTWKKIQTTYLERSSGCVLMFDQFGGGTKSISDGHC